MAPRLQPVRVAQQHSRLIRARPPSQQGRPSPRHAAGAVPPAAGRRRSGSLEPQAKGASLTRRRAPAGSHHQSRFHCPAPAGSSVIAARAQACAPTQAGRALKVLMGPAAIHLQAEELLELMVLASNIAKAVRSWACAGPTVMTTLCATTVLRLSRTGPDGGRSAGCSGGWPGGAGGCIPGERGGGPANGAWQARWAPPAVAGRLRGLAWLLLCHSIGLLDPAAAADPRLCRDVAVITDVVR